MRVRDATYVSEYFFCTGIGKAVGVGKSCEERGGGFVYTLICALCA